MLVSLPSIVFTEYDHRSQTERYSNHSRLDLVDESFLSMSGQEQKWSFTHENLTKWEYYILLFTIENAFMQHLLFQDVFFRN